MSYIFRFVIGIKINRFASISETFPWRFFDEIKEKYALVFPCMKSIHQTDQCHFHPLKVAAQHLQDVTAILVQG